MSATGKRVGAIREHKCGNPACAKVELWAKDWRWVVIDGRLDDTVCSDRCEAVLRSPSIAPVEAAS